MCVGRPGGLEGSIVALRRFQHAGDTAAKAAAIAIGVRPHLGDAPLSKCRGTHGGCGRGQKEPRALGVRRGARRSASRNVRPERQTLDPPLGSQSKELGSQRCGARLGFKKSSDLQLSRSPRSALQARPQSPPKRATSSPGPACCMRGARRFPNSRQEACRPFPRGRRNGRQGRTADFGHEHALRRSGASLLHAIV